MRCLFVLLLLLAAPAAAQPADQAAALRVIYADVDVRLADTDAWLSLPPGAVTPLGVGDSARPSRRGRALVTLDGVGTILALPESVVTLRDDGLLLERGRVILDADADAPFRIETPHLRADVTDGLIAVQAHPGVASMVISARGDVSVSAGGEEVVVVAGEGVRGRDGRSALDAVVDLRGDLLGFSRLEAALDGCPGFIREVGTIDLNVRIGPSFEYDAVGSLEVGQEVALLAVSPNNERYRVRFLGGFGWILALGVETTCTGLPTLPYNTVESNLGTVNPDPAETPLIVPFFGTPADDFWFYGGF